MKPSRIMLMVVLVILPLFVFGSAAIAADDQATDKTPGIESFGFGGGSEVAVTPGDILWGCDVEHVDGDSDNQILGVEFDGYYYYLTAGGGSFYSPNDTNKVHIWERVGSSCNYVCSVNQPNPFASSTWGWRDMAFDGTYLYACEEPGSPATACTVQAWTADCSGVTLHTSADIVLTLATFPTISIARALAYDPANDWFWTADWTSAVYAFDRSGNLMQTIANPGNSIYGLAWDDVSPGGPYLWAHCQSATKTPDVKVLQIDPNATPGSEWTGVNYAGVGDASGGVAGGLCLNREGCLSLVGVSQVTPDSIYAMEIYDGIVYDNLDTIWVPWAKVGRFANDRPVLGFRIDCVDTPDTLKQVLVKSFITKAFSVDTIRLYAETNGSQGLQVGTGGDTKIAERNTHQLEFDSNDTLRFFGFARALSAGSNKFYIALCAHSDSIGAAPLDYHGEHLEVLIPPGGIVLASGSNPDSVYNRPYGGINDDSTGFCANDPSNPGYPDCRYRLILDTEPPAFTIHYEVLQSCAPDTIDQEDTIRIYATGVASDMDSIYFESVLGKGFPFFGFPNFVLKGDTPIPWEDTLIIPDTNWTMPPAIDIDTGLTVDAVGVDTAGNLGYDTIYFTEPIDTYKPVIDSTLFFIQYDANNDGVAALGDSLGIIVFCENNPKFEVSRGVFADLSNYFPTHASYSQVPLIDITDNNWIFRAIVYLDPDSSEGIDYAADSSMNVLYITAYDNACNYQMDTAGLGAPIDIEKPILADLFYLYHWDHDTTHWCIGIGDSVKMGVDLTASPDVESVWVDMFDAGIDSGLFWAWYPLFDDGSMALHNDATAGDLLYNLKWKVGNPPLAQGKDADNTTPPPVDADYSVLIKAMDDVGNWDTLRSGQLNRTLDSRRPRPINSASLQVTPKAGAKIEIRWPRTADENDAWWFYIDSTTDLTHWGEIGNFWDGWSGPTNNIWLSEHLVDGQYYCFRITTKDNCDNTGPYTVNICALADGTPPNACIVLPDSGGTYGAPFAVKARSEDEDIDSVSLWYRLWPFYPDSVGRSPWMECSPDMYRPDTGYVFFDTVNCVHDYVGWVELLPKACDVIGNCQDIDSAYAHACLDDDAGNLVPGHFFFYWDTTTSVVLVESVNDTIWPQSACGFNVSDTMINTVVLNVVGATAADSYSIDVRALVNDVSHRIDYRNNVTMPCTILVSVENWDAGTQNLWAYVTDQGNGKNCTPYPLVVDLCVPQQFGPCMAIVAPHEWERIPCSKTDLTCVPIWAYSSPTCDTMVTQVQFRWASDPSGPWYFIDEVIDTSGGYWKTCWNNKEWFDADMLHDGDTVYFIAIGYNQFHVVDTSMMVKVFLDCSTPQVKLLVEDLFYSCGNDIPKISCDPLTFKAFLDTSMHDTVDIVDVDFWVKDHSDPDMFAYWSKIGDAGPAHNENIWMYLWENPCYVPAKPMTPSLMPNTYYDFRVTARDQAGNRTFDFDEDGKFDDSTFLASVAIGAGITVFVDNEAPQPAFSMVADTVAPIYNVNPSTSLGGTGDAYVKAHNPVRLEVSVLPSEDTCEVKKVEYFLGAIDTIWVIEWIDTVFFVDTSCVESTWVEPGTGHWQCTDWDYDTTCYYDTTFVFEGQIDTSWHHVSTGTDPYHFPITFNPWDLPEIIPHYEFEDGWWQGALKAVLYDSLENYNTDLISLYVLDVDPSQALIVQPMNDSYIWGDVTLKVRALNAYQICKVVYEYRIFGEDIWYPVLNGESEDGPYFPVVWHTPNIPDGKVCLRARAMDCSNNWDDDPPTICVWIDNGQPTIVLDDPRQCERTCPDDTVDTLGYVSDIVTLYATATPNIAPVTKVYFYYKSIFSYPSNWTFIGVDYFRTSGQYSVKWNTAGLEGRYHVKARVVNAAGRYNDSDPITVTVDNTAPFSQIVSIDGNHYPNGMDITRGDVISIELWAMDSSSSEGWTRCYNSGVYTIEVCMENCKTGVEITKCFEVAPSGKPTSVEPPYDGFHTVEWNTSGLEFTGCSGCYYLYVKATDCLGNMDTSEHVTVYVSDVTAPITTIGGFDGNYIYGYSSERVKTLLFEYADSGGTNWIPIGWSDTLHIESYKDGPSGSSCGYYLYKTTWDPTSLADGIYQVRVISHDTCSNQDDSLAPWAFIHVESGIITPYNPDALGALSFEKNWCVGGMHGLVRETCSEGTPVVIGRYLATYECVDMQSDLQNTTEYAGSFFASDIDGGGPAKFFSSVTVTPDEEPMTGEPAAVTYLRTGNFDVVQVKRDVGTHGTYQDGCMEVTIPAGAVGGTFTYDRYIWVAPTMMPWAPVTQPDILPIGDNNGYATYVSFTDCYYCCGWWASHFGGDQEGEVLKSGGGSSFDDTCCFNPGKYAIIKMCYDESIDTDEEHLAVMRWDCQSGMFKFDPIFYPATVEGFDTENHTVEFATTCLNGPFAVVELLERECDGSIVVSMREQDIEPYCNGYTNSMPTFTSLITDNVQGTAAIDTTSIQFKIDLYNPGQLIRIYNGAGGDDFCDLWMTGFGSFLGSGYDPVSGIFRAGWNDPDYYNYYEYWGSCAGCYNYYCKPQYPLDAGSHMAVVTAMNKNIQTCTDTVQFTVDATDPKMWFADSVGAWVGANPHFCMYFTDLEAGVDKSSIWIDIYGDETTQPDPNNHSPIGTLRPDQLHWVDDTTVCVDFTFDYDLCGYLHIFVYGGPDDCRCGGECAYPDFYDYTCGIADCVGNHADVFWQYFSVDAEGPTVTFVGDNYCDERLQFEITDKSCYYFGAPGTGSGLHHVYIYEDSTLASIEQDPHNPDFWWYTPSDGVERVDIKAVDNIGNVTVYSFDLPSDCEAPAVTFADGYVSKNPAIKFWVTDPSGVDWTTVNARVTGCGEECWYRAEDLPAFTNTGTGEVVLDGCHLDCYDGDEVEIYVFSGTSYTGDGPCDLEGNCGVYRRCSFVVDAYGPSVTWKNSSDPCDRPVKLQITDAKSGLAEVKAYEDGIELTEEAFVYDTTSGLYHLTPSAGIHDIDVVATDLLGNETIYSFEIRDDCQGPGVSFIGGYVTKNPTLQFVVKDEGSGVDWSTVNAWVTGCSEECVYLAPELVKHVRNDTVTLDDCHLDCSDGQEVEVYVYSGTNRYGMGPADSAGNFAPAYSMCSYVVDAVAPYCDVNSLSGRPIVITITDSKSGVDWSTLEFWEDSLLICEGLECTDTTISIDTAKGIIKYMPPAGRLYVDINIRDKAGNLATSCSFYTEEEQLSLNNPHNYPNPFDPREMRTTIVLGLSKSAYVTAKIYDFAGEYVTTLAKDDWCGTSSSYWLHWNATTEDGTPVADGTYLCYIKARDEDGDVRTAVIKIAVLKKDK